MTQPEIDVIEIQSADELPKEPAVFVFTPQARSRGQVEAFARRQNNPAVYWIKAKGYAWVRRPVAKTGPLPPLPAPQPAAQASPPNSKGEFRGRRDDPCLIYFSRPLFNI
jgi:hypothetical protein